MDDVIIALLPLAAWGVYCFGLPALTQILLCVVSCLFFEFLIMYGFAKKVTIFDGSAIITGLILALSLPASAPWFVPVVGSLIAIGVGKAVFGGLGQNIYNPAMVGRAFAMISFSQFMGASAYQMKSAQLADATNQFITQATPLSDLSKTISFDNSSNFYSAFLGLHNGSVGETSIPLILLGLGWLLYRRVISWELPIVAVLAFSVLCGLSQLIPHLLSSETLKYIQFKDPMLYAKLHFTIPHHLLSGAFLFGAVFIITDPVTNPMSRMGRIIFAIGFAFFVWGFRMFSSYPEGVMFAVLLMNSLSPLIERFTVPAPVGGPLPLKKKV